DRVAAMGDVGKGAAVYQGRCAFQGLYHVRHQGILEQRGHGAISLDVGTGDGLQFAGVTHNDGTQAATQVFDVGGQTENGHDFRGDSNIETGLTREAVAGATQAGDDVAQGAVVHVDDAAPVDTTHVNTEIIA